MINLIRRLKRKEFDTLDGQKIRFERLVSNLHIVYGKNKTFFVWTKNLYEKKNRLLRITNFFFIDLK